MRGILRTLVCAAIVNIWIAAFSFGATDKWEVIHGSERQSDMILRGHPDMAEVTFTVRNVSAGPRGGQEISIALVYDSFSRLAWWTWPTASRWRDPSTNAGDAGTVGAMGPSWAIAKTLDGRALVGFRLTQHGEFGVRVSRLAANSLLEAQAAAARALSELEDPITNVPGISSGQRKPDPEFYVPLKLNAGAVNRYRGIITGDFFSGGSSSGSSPDVRLLSITPRSYGWDVEMQGARLPVGLPQTAGPPQMAVFSVSHDFRFIAPGYTVIGDPVRRAGNLADGSPAEVLQFTAGSTAEPPRPKFNISMLRDPASNGVWWHWWIPEREPSPGNRGIMPPEGPLSRRMDTWMVGRAPEAGGLLGFVIAPSSNLQFFARASTLSASSATEGVSRVLAELATGIPLPDAGLVYINPDGAVRSKFPGTNVGVGSIRRVSGTTEGWEIEFDSGAHWPIVTLSKEFEFIDAVLLPARRR